MTKARSVVGDALVFLAHGLRPEDVVQLAFDPLHAKRVSGAGLAYLEKHQESLGEKHPSIDLAELRLLPALCDRIVRAQRETESARRVLSPIRGLVSAAMRWRRQLLPLADSLASQGRLAPEVVKGIHAGRGALNNVQDVIDLCVALAPFEAVVTAACGKGSLDEARVAAEAALTAAGAQSESAAAAAASADLRDRFATLVIQRHDRLRVVVALVSSFKEAQRIVGGLRQSGRRKSKEAAPEAPILQPVPA